MKHDCVISLIHANIHACQGVLCCFLATSHAKLGCTRSHSSNTRCGFSFRLKEINQTSVGLEIKVSQCLLNLGHFPSWDELLIYPILKTCTHHHKCWCTAGQVWCRSLEQADMRSRVCSDDNPDHSAQLWSSGGPWTPCCTRYSISALDWWIWPVSCCEIYGLLWEASFLLCAYFLPLQ